ncbi:LOW QUALITY PROTEIN: hypothetical protein Cgig2_019207 [Carnegiea gigantea]|uniref:Ubiquitin-like protease family profile domain-containing protein n=1 Tax=Carnegiea gigantea TaxID=171969 RepID=A0A9Q1JGR0_9CARY|nr:LOW QUALITY PROTEIN: hypothetical protein Cgig2_019207 [Carnegiea gigantea]
MWQKQVCMKSVQARVRTRMQPARQQRVSSVVQQPVPEVGKSGAMPGPHVREAAASTDGPGAAVADVYVGGDSAAREGECTSPASSAANEEDCTHAAMEGGILWRRMILGWSPCTMHHRLQQTLPALMRRHPLVGDSGHMVTTPEQVGEIAGETEMTSPDVDDVGIENRPQFMAAHSLNQLVSPSARKSKKEMKEGVTGADEAPAVDDPAEGSVDPPILDVQPLSVEGSSISPSVEELNKFKLMKEVLAGYIFTPLSATRMELVTKIGRKAYSSACRSSCRQVGYGASSMWFQRGSCVQVTLHNKGHISGVIWDNLKATPQPDVRYVLLPLLEKTNEHWFLLVADLRERSFLVYDSLPSPVAKIRRELVDSARIAFILAFLRSSTYVDAGHWEVLTPNCPEQRNGHDCGVFVMAFMKLLSLKADGFEFDQDCVPYYRDKCLLSFLQG